MDTLSAVRAFNRFYTSHVGALDRQFLDSGIPLPEARLLFEIATRQPVLAKALQQGMDIDRGYLSRMVARFEKRGWISRAEASGDARARPIQLTAAGRAVFDEIDQKQQSLIMDMMDGLSAVEQADLVTALARVRMFLNPATISDFSLRTGEIGDAALVASRQSMLYAESHGWGRPLECIEAETVASYLRNFKPGQDQMWVAEIDDVLAGAVFLTAESNGTSRLRLLHVEPFARRRGIGDALVKECVRFARHAGYQRIILWTHRVLEPARRIYARHGFECVGSEVHYEFGEPVQGEHWALELAPQFGARPHS